jgi:hypothetical protein
MIRRCLRVGIVTALGLVASACGKSNGAEAVKAAESIADAICACKDMDCVTKVGTSRGKELDKAGKLDAKESAAIKAAGQRANDCISKLQPPPEAAAGGDGGPAATPPAPQ